MAKCPCGQQSQVPTPVQLQKVEETVVAIPVEEPLVDLWDDLGEPEEDPFASASPLMPTQNYQNPYAAPARVSKKKRKPKRQIRHSDIQQVISGQKLLIYALLGYLFIPFLGILMIFAGAVVETMDENSANALAFGLVGFILVLGIAVLIMAICGLARMGRVVIGPWWVLMLPGMLFPLLALVILIIVNSQATGFLRANGVKVGFLGAK